MKSAVTNHLTISKSIQFYLQASFGVDLIVEGVDGDEIPGTGKLFIFHAVAEVVLQGPKRHESLEAAERIGRTLSHLHVAVTAQRVDYGTVFLSSAAPAFVCHCLLGNLKHPC